MAKLKLAVQVNHAKRTQAIYHRQSTTDSLIFTRSRSIIKLGIFGWRLTRLLQWSQTETKTKTKYQYVALDTSEQMQSGQRRSLTAVQEQNIFATCVFQIIFILLDHLSTHTNMQISLKDTIKTVFHHIHIKPPFNKWS